MKHSKYHINGTHSNCPAWCPGLLLWCTLKFQYKSKNFLIEMPLLPKKHCCSPSRTKHSRPACTKTIEIFSNKSKQ